MTLEDPQDRAQEWRDEYNNLRITFGLSIKENLHGFLADSVEIYETVLFKNNFKIIVILTAICTYKIILA